MAMILIPGLITWQTGQVNPGWSLASPWNEALYISGLGLILAGLILIVKTIALFMTAGRGTLAPWDPTQKLVVRGVYRHVRNPMISGVFAVLLGEAVLLGSRPLFRWFLLFVLINAVYIPLSEEPGLRRRFGADYERYTKNVPRWIPRLRPWNEPVNGDNR